jgi:flagellar biosynthesis/type III secretory pathway protein FliH
MASSPDRFEPWRPPALSAAAAAVATAPGPPPATAGWSPAELGAAGVAAARSGPSDVERAWQEGYAEGARRGLQEAEALLGPAGEALRGVVERLRGAETSFAHDRVRHLETLAVAVARQLVQRELTADPALVRERVEKALELVPRDAALQIRMHPLDLDAVQSAVGEADGGEVALEWIPDPGLDRGSFVLETPQRVVDGRADVALRALFERLDHA